MKRFIYLSLMFFFLLFLIQGSFFSSSATVNSETETLSENINTEDELIRINIRYPIIRGGGNKKILDKINQKFKNEALKFKNDIEKSAREGYEVSKKQNIPFNPYEAHEDFKVTFNKNNVLSIPVTFYFYTGGAHGGSFIQPNNIDILTGKFLTLSDIFKDGYDYKTVLLKNITESIRANPEDYFPDALQTVENLNDNHPFYLTDEGIVLYYGEYEIAPYAAGIREFRIPFTELKDGIKERFLTS